MTFFNTGIFHYIVPTGKIIYVAAILVVMWFFVRRCQSVNLSPYHALSACIYSIICGILGARLFYLILHLEKTINQPLKILNIGGGTVSWGAYLCGIMAFITYFYLKKLPVMPYLDAMFSVFGLGPFIGRWACFLNGCCFGTITSLPWGVQFPRPSSAFSLHLNSGLIEQTATLSLAIHPVQIYSSLASLTIFIMVSIFWNKYRKINGATFCFYLLLYCSVRFFIEFFRGDAQRFDFLNLTLSQIICILIVVGVLFTLLIRNIYTGKINFIKNK
jgi:phosphatidylglycerol:prolipoprotein diacylglycerol transferase